MNEQNSPTDEKVPDIGFDQDDLLRLIDWDMPFGRFKGTALIDVPEDYYIWFRRKGWPKGQLGRMMQIALQLKIDGADKIVKDLRNLPQRNLPRSTD